MLDELFFPPESLDKEMAPQTIAVGMSGGVDSSVCAALLKATGHKVVGLFMKNWEENDEHGVCQASKDFADVQKVCDHLGIDCYSVDFVDEYREQVFSSFLQEYQNGHTPNPDILCNREIKFKVFYDYAMRLGADKLATGHYCQKRLIDGRWHLVEGVDPNKGQAYFLHAIDGAVLEKVLFPLGHLHKSDVRKLAQEFNLPTATKKDSTGICFIGPKNFTQFLSRFITTKPGLFKRLEGEVVGEHQGASFYTLGQRKGLGLGGQGEAWFVVGKDNQHNIVYVERGEFHPALYCQELLAKEESWVVKTELTFPFHCQAKVRYRQQSVDCVVERMTDDTLQVRFKSPMRAVTPRQSVVFYQGDVCLGGAMIETPGPSFYEMKKDLPSPEFLVH